MNIKLPNREKLTALVVRNYLCEFEARKLCGTSNTSDKTVHVYSTNICIHEFLIPNVRKTLAVYDD